MKRMKGLISFLCAVVIVASMIMTVPTAVSAAKGDMTYRIVNWNGQEWELQSTELADGSLTDVSYIDEEGNLNIEAKASGYMYVNYPPGVVDANGNRQYNDPDGVLSMMAGGDTDRNNDAFDINFRMKFKHRVELFAGWYHGLVRMHFRNANTLIYQTGGSPDSYSVMNIEMGEDWHDWTIKVRGIHATVMMDGKELFSYVLFRRASAATHIRFRTSYEYDYVAHTQIQNVEVVDKRGKDVTLIQPNTWATSSYTNIKYKPNESITFEADTGAGDGEKHTVDFYLNGVKIGSAVDQGDITTESGGNSGNGCEGSGGGSTTDPAHNAILTLKNGLPAGTYIVKAVWDGKESSERVIVVKYETTAKVECADNANYGDVVNANVAYTGITPKTIEYFVDGQSVGTVNAGESFGLSGMSVGSHMIDAKLYLEDGTQFDVDEKQINVSASDAVTDFNREYRLDYNLSGKGNVLVNDGYFELDFRHDGSTLTYADENGTKTYSGLGDGRYRVVATAGYAEVYYNGQMIFTYRMPYLGKSDKTATHTGGISDFTMSASGVKATRFHKDLDGNGDVEEYGMDFSKYYSFEFDKTDSSSESVMFYDGNYEVIMEMNGDGITVNSQNKTSDPTTKVKIADTVKPGYYRVTVAEGMTQLSLNNVVIGTWRSPLNPHRRSILRKMSNPAATTFVAVKNTDDVYYHSDDFEGNIEEGFKSEDYWYNDEEYYALKDGESYKLTHAVKGDDNDKYLELSGEGEYMLNCNADNPIIRWKSTYEGTGGFEANVRSARRYDGINVVYDASTGTWDLKISIPAADMPEGSTTNITMKKETDIVSDVSFPLDAGEHAFELVVKNKKLTFSCDGNKIIETDKIEDSFTLTETANEVTKTYTLTNDRKHGRFIFAVNGGTLKVDDFEYIGNGRVAAGVSHAITDVNFDYYKNYKGQIVAASNDYANPIMRSSDGGLTWDVTYASELRKGKLSANTVNLMSGKVLRMKSDLKDDVTTNSKYSYALLYDIGVDTEATRATSGGRVVEYSSNRVMIEPDGSMDGVPYSGMGCRIMQLTEGPYAGRVIYTRGGSGEEYGRVFMYYSDDYKDVDFQGTPVWHEPNVQFTYWNTGENVWESQCVEMPGGTVRMYVRSDKGYLTYFESYDGGATWDVNGRKTENLIAPSCCFSIQRMPGTETYCVFWEYDTITSDLHYLEHPRNRAAFAISYDGMKTWEYVADMEETGINVSSARCNHSMRVIDNAAYMGFYAQSGCPGWSRSFRQDLTKVKPLKRFSGLHYRVSSYMENQPDDQKTDYCVIPKTTGEALIYGNFIQTEVNNGYADANIVAKTVGATAAISGTTVTLTMGTTSVVFTEGATSYIINGETVDAGYVMSMSSYLHPRVAEIFGKYVYECDGSYVVHRNYVNEAVLGEIESVGTSTSAEVTRESSLLADMNVAAKHGSGKEINVVLNEYSDVLELSLDNREKIYERMTGITYYTIDDIKTVYHKAVEAQDKAETLVSGIALSTVSGSFDEWCKLGKNSGTAEISGDTVQLSVTNGYNDKFVFGTPGIEIPVNGYNFTFDYCRESGDGAVNIKIGNHETAVNLAITGNKIITYGAHGSSVVETTVAENQWYTFKGFVTKDEAGSYLTLYMGDSVVCQDLLLAENIIRGFWTTVEDGSLETFKLRKVRVYEGKAMDVIAYTTADGKVSATVDFLNDINVIDKSWFDEDFTSTDINFNDGSKFRQTAIQTEHNVVTVEDGAMHYFKPLELTEGFEQNLLLSPVTDGNNPKNFIFEYDFMVPKAENWTQTADTAYMYFDVYRNYPTTLRQTTYIYKERLKFGSTSLYYKNICGTENYDGMWMSFKYRYYFENNQWNCDVYYKLRSALEWNLLGKVAMNTKTHNNNYIRFYAYPEDQVDFCIDNVKVYPDDKMGVGNQLIAGVYNNGVQAGIGCTDVDLSGIGALEVRRYELTDIPYNAVEGVKPEIKLFMWNNLGKMVPLTDATVIGAK